MSAASPNIIETRWWHVRHAPVPDGGRIYGQRDLDCDCSNATVFRSVAAVLPKDAVWVTSGLKRAQQTAAAIHAASGGKHTPKEIPAYTAFNEQHLGDWQGVDRNEFRKMRSLTAKTFWLTQGDEKAPNGESYPDLVKRVAPLIGELTAAHRGRNIISVTHGGTIRSAIAHALSSPLEMSHAFTIENVSITVLDHLHDPAAPDTDVWRVSHVNAMPWLGVA
jgi:alpha-ribazole phosphatase